MELNDLCVAVGVLWPAPTAFVGGSTLGDDCAAVPASRSTRFTKDRSSRLWSMSSLSATSTRSPKDEDRVSSDRYLHEDHLPVHNPSVDRYGKCQHIRKLSHSSPRYSLHSTTTDTNLYRLLVKAPVFRDQRVPRRTGLLRPPGYRDHTHLRMSPRSFRKNFLSTIHSRALDQHRDVDAQLGTLRPKGSQLRHLSFEQEYTVMRVTQLHATTPCPW